jgi:hypothetical protein
LKKNGVLNEHQYNFLSEVLSEKGSHILLNEILAAMNSKQMGGGIYCDLHKDLTVLIM